MKCWSRLIVLVMLAICSAGVVPVFAQTSPESGTPPNNWTPVRVRDFSQYLNQDVVVDGVSLQLNNEINQNTRVYILKDDWGDETLVRTKQGGTVTGVRYRVEGIVEQEGAAYVLIEQTRSSAAEKPSNSGTNIPSSAGNVHLLFGLPRMTVIGIGLIMLGLLVGAIIITFLHRHTVATRQLMRDQRRHAMERERQHHQVAVLQAAAIVGVPADTVQPSPDKRKNRVKNTVEAWGQLKVTSGPQSGLVVPLTGRQITIGREEGNLQLPDDSMVSARHAEIVATNDGRLLYVDKSRNGSMVDGKPVHRMQTHIQLDSIIEIGSSRIEMRAMRFPGIAAGEFQSSTDASSPDPTPTPSMTEVALRVISGADSHKRFPIVKDIMTIGRREDQDIVLTDGFVSREHAVLSHRGGEWVLRNLSAKGTTINGKPCNESLLEHGSRIALGATVLEFSMEGEVRP